MLYEYLKAFKEAGAPIAYNRFRQTYYYREAGEFKICFEKIAHSNQVGVM
jgi:hypothetical protein